MKIRRAFAAPACATIGCMATSLAAAEVRYNCSVIPATSSLTQATDLGAPFAGTFIGDYDATTNATGTRTLPGIFGGSGNNPITYSASFALAGDIVSHPIGAFSAAVDLDLLQIRISDLDLDMLGGVPGVLAATLNINYQTFHTVQPTAIYPGGVTIPVPLGNGSVTTLRASQSGAAAPGILVPQKNGSFNFTTVVPVDFITVATVLGQPAADGTPVPGVLPLTGNLSVAADGSIALSASISNSTTTTQPITTGGTFTDLPLAIPTVIPTGSTANVLMSGAVTSVTIASSLSASLVVSGVRAPIPGDVNGDFRVNSQDITVVLSNWNGTGPGDCTGDNYVDSRDITVILANWQ